MVKTTYHCDLCKAKRSKNELYGFTSIGPSDYHLQGNLKGCGDRHLCRYCLKSILESWQDVAPEVMEMSGPMPPSSPA